MTLALTYTPGDFSFILDENLKSMLNDAYIAISLAENWEVMKLDPGSDGFMYSELSYMNAINANIKYPHSGYSYAKTMRVMQYIARYGWETFLKDSIS